MRKAIGPYKVKRMALGERTMICCIDRRTELITDLFKESGLDNLLVIADYGILTPEYTTDKGRRYEDSLEMVVRNHYPIPRMKFVRYNIYNFDEMMRALNSIIQKVRSWKSTPYISIACGTGEYCAAASIISMMNKDVHLIGNYSRDILIPYETIGKHSRFMGQTDFGAGTMTESGISEIEKFELPKPDIYLLRALKIYQETDLGMRSSSNIIKKLKEDGIWYRLKNEPLPLDHFTDSIPENHPRISEDEEKKRMYKEKNFYVRDIMSPWKDAGWVEAAPRTISGYEITDKGRRMMYIFLFEDDEHPIHEIKPEDTMSERNLHDILYRGEDFINKIDKPNKD